MLVLGRLLRESIVHYNEILELNGVDDEKTGGYVGDFRWKIL